MAARRDGHRGLFHARGWIAAAILCSGITCASADVRVVDAGSGTLVVEAHDATVRQVLEALSETRTIQFRDSEALSRVVTGRYSGTLPRVLARILDGYDHVIQSTPSGVRLSIVLPARNARPTATVANSVAPVLAPVAVVSPAVGQRVSSNVDLDEEMALAASRPSPVVAPRTRRPPALSIAAAPAVLSGPAQGSAARISNNVDLDEETR